MKEKTSVNRAILIGHLWITLPIVLIMGAFPILAVYLVSIDLISAWGIAVVFAIGFGFAWLYWSYFITKWKVWAFENVRNVHELKRKAIENSLIWRDDVFFEKTEIRNTSDKQKLNKLDQKFQQKDIFKEDHSLPKKTEIYYSKVEFYIEVFCLTLVAMTVGIYLIYVSEWNSINKSFILGLICLFFGIYSLFKFFKKVNLRQPLLIIDDKGITINTVFKSWSNISDEQIIREGIGNSTKTFLIYFDKTESQNAIERYGRNNFDTFYENLSLEYEKIRIDNFNVSRKQMENIIRTYRIRYEKGN